MRVTTGFQPTHTLGGVPVRKEKRPPTGGRLDRFPVFLDEAGNTIWPAGKKALPIPLPPEVIVYGQPPDAPPAPKPPVEEVSPCIPPPPGSLAPFDVEVAAAILRAAAWPLYGEAIGYAETARGHSATLDGKTPDGAARVKVCVTGPQGGRFLTVRVPQEITFEITVEEE